VLLGIVHGSKHFGLFFPAGQLRRLAARQCKVAQRAVPKGAVQPVACRWRSAAASADRCSAAQSRPESGGCAERTRPPPMVCV